MAWVLLMIAGLLEVAWAIGLKYTEGFTKVVPSVLTAVGIAGSMYLLSVASRTISIGTAYAVWVGIGAAGTAIASAMLFGERMTIARVLCLMLLVAGIVGLKLTSER